MGLLVSLKTYHDASQLAVILRFSDEESGKDALADRSCDEPPHVSGQRRVQAALRIRICNAGMGVLAGVI
jgi:hypothetical protein